MKTCGICNESKPLSEFASKGTGTQWCCRTCQADYRRTHYNQNKQKYISKAKTNRSEYKRQYYEWLANQKCVDCGNDDIRVLEQDHLCDKKYNIAKKVGAVPLETLLPELSKCETVCANCHRIRTAERGNWVKGLYSLS